MENKNMKSSGVEWIGEIPIDWNIKSIRYLIVDHFGGSWGDDEKGTDNDRICMRIADFDFGRMQFKELDKECYTVRNYSNNDIVKKSLKYGDLLIEKSGGGEKTPVGRTVVYRLPHNAIFANFMDCIRLSGEIDVEYAKYAFYSLYQNGVTNLYFNQTTGLQNLNISKYFREVKLPLPLLSTQSIISNFLDNRCSEINALMTDIQSQIETLEQYKQSVIVETVTKGLNPNTEMQDTNTKWLGSIPKDWKLSKISNVYTLRNTKVSDKDYPPLSVTMNGVVPQLETAAKTNAHDDRKLVKKGDFAINSRSDRRGSCGIADMDGSVSLINTILCPKGEMNPRYYNWLFHTVEFADEFYANGHGIVDDLWTTGWQEMKRILIPTPPLNVQQEIADYLDNKSTEIDSIIADKKAQLETLDDYKKSLIYEYVTGKKQVKENA